MNTFFLTRTFSIICLAIAFGGVDSPLWAKETKSSRQNEFSQVKKLDLSIPDSAYEQYYTENATTIYSRTFNDPDEYDAHTPLVLIHVGNDILGVQSKVKDRYFSNNLNIAVVTENVPKFFKDLTSRTPNTSYMVMAAQYMYTPEDLTKKELDTDDRPYAGWLFIRLQSTDRKHNYLIVTGIQAGMIGPASGAEAMQKWFHEITGSTPPQGWQNQLENELGVNVYQMRAIGWRQDFNYFDHELILNAGVTMGNVNTHAQIGVLYRLGYNIPNDLGAAYLNPDEMAMTGVGDNSLRTQATHPSSAHENFTAYVFVSADGRYVARDIFLDGNTFQDSHSVEKNNVITAYKTGLVLGRKGFEVGVVTTQVSEQFKSQNGPSRNGMIFIRYTKKFR